MHSHGKPRLIQTSNSLSMNFWKEKNHPWSDKSMMEWLNKSREQVILLSNLIFIQSPRMSSHHFFCTTQPFRAARFFHYTDSSLLLCNSKTLAHKCEKLISKLANFTCHSTWAHSAAQCWIVITFLSFTFCIKENNISQLGTVLNTEASVAERFLKIFSLVGKYFSEFLTNPKIVNQSLIKLSIMVCTFFWMYGCKLNKVQTIVV